MFNIKDYGAKGDGETVDTAAIQSALDACKDAGGGEVYFPAGRYLSGTLVVPSYTTLNISTGATLLGSTNLEDFPRDNRIIHGDRTGFHLIRIADAERVTITGGGVIDGQGPAYWDDGKGRGYRLALDSHHGRPSPMIAVMNCQDIRIENVTLRDTPGWALHLYMTDRSWVRGISIINPMDGPNTDGIDVDACHDVIISDCYIVNGDDSIVIFSAPNTRSSERITITNCIISTRCAAIKVYAHEMWNSPGNSTHAIRQITASNCVVFNSERAVAIYLWGDAIFEDFVFSNFVIDTGSTAPNFADRPLQIDSGHDRHAPSDQPIGKLRGVVWENMQIRTPGRILVAARPGTVENLRISNITLHITGDQDLKLLGERSPSTQQFAYEISHTRGTPAHVVIHGVDGLDVDGIEVVKAADELAGRHGLWLENVTGERIKDFACYPLPQGFEIVHKT